MTYYTIYKSYSHWGMFPVITFWGKYLNDLDTVVNAATKTKCAARPAH
jgi:hypothetical protein